MFGSFLPELWLVDTIKVYSGHGSRHCYGIISPTNDQAPVFDGLTIYAASLLMAYSLNNPLPIFLRQASSSLAVSDGTSRTRSARATSTCPWLVSGISGRKRTKLPSSSLSITNAGRWQSPCFNNALV